MANSAIKVVGRLDPAEAGRPEYGFLPPRQRTRATLAKPGTMFVIQPEIPVPLAVEFPFPAWATRQSECGTPPAAPVNQPAATRSAGCRGPTDAHRSDPSTVLMRRSHSAPTEGFGVRFLHTSDWHVGKTLKGRNRLDEQRAGARRDRRRSPGRRPVDAVLVAGDLYDTAAPSADAQQLVVRALLALRDDRRRGGRDRRQPRPRRPLSTPTGR